MATLGELSEFTHQQLDKFTNQELQELTLEEIRKRIQESSATGEKAESAPAGK